MYTLLFLKWFLKVAEGWFLCLGGHSLLENGIIRAGNLLHFTTYFTNFSLTHVYRVA